MLNTRRDEHGYYYIDDKLYDYKGELAPEDMQPIAGTEYDYKGEPFKQELMITPEAAPEVPTTTVTPEVTPQDQIAQLKAAQLAARIGALDTAKTNALGNLANEEAAIKPQYYSVRNQVAGQSDVGKMNFAQYMAARGIKGSAGSMPEIYRNASLQQNLGNLNAQEQAALDEIARNRTGIENAYESDRVAATNEVEAQAMQNFINQMNADRNYGLSEAGVTGTYKGLPTLEGQKYQDTVTQNEREQYWNTINRYGSNYQKEIDNVTNNGDTSDDWKLAYLESARQTKIQGLAEAAAKTAAAAGEATRQEYLDAIELWKLAGKVTPEIAEILGIPEGTPTADYDIKRIEANVRQQNADSISANKPETPKEYDYTTDEGFKEDAAKVSSGDVTLADVQANKAAIIAAYGQAGYDALVRLATP